MVKKVSVCMPTYNQEAYIEQAINGVLQQEGCDWELIIANDGSTDNTYSICKGYQEKFPDKIKLINQSHNKGLIENTKECILASSGIYIAICEGDDYWIDPLKLKKQVSILDNDPAVSMVHSNWVNYYENQARFVPRVISEKKYICESQNGRESVEEIMMETYRGIRFSSICFRKDEFLKAYTDDPLLFSPLYSTCDISLFYELAYRGRLYYLNEVTTVYRIQNESVSITSNQDKKIGFTKGVLYLQVHFIDKYKLSDRVRDKVFRNRYQLLLPYALHHSDIELAGELKDLAKKFDYKLRFSQLLCYWGCKNRILKKAITTII